MQRKTQRSCASGARDDLDAQAADIGDEQHGEPLQRGTPSLRETAQRQQQRQCQQDRDADAKRGRRRDQACGERGDQEQVTADDRAT